MKDNFGTGMAIAAAVALLLDYLLNVSVAIAAGVSAIVSAVPALQPYTLALCLGVLGVLSVVNLRGVRETGRAFVLPVLAFVTCMAIVLGCGLVRAIASGGHPQAIVPAPILPASTTHVGTWILLCAFANGLTAMTGVEAVSNGVPLFREPRVKHAQQTLAVITTILAVFLLAIAWLCRAYGVGAMDESAPGYQTILSQLVQAVFRRGVFYYVAVASIFAVLTFSAQTSFADFPRVCRFLAEDRFLPRGYAKRGRRLVFSNGIVVLTIVSAVLLIAFDGVTDRLIPLFALGAFTAFLLSQVAMVKHWLLRRNERGRLISLAYNALGATTTAVALVLIVAVKVREGAWIVLLVGPALAFVLFRIRKYYDTLYRATDLPMPLWPAPLRPPIAIVPIEGWNGPAEKAIRFALRITNDVIALHVSTESVDTKALEVLWSRKVEAASRAHDLPRPRLEIVRSPYRLVHEPIVDVVRREERDHPDRLVALVLPELLRPRWWETLVRNVEAAALKTQIEMACGKRTFVIYVPWHLHDT